jgi:hypothetical protein
VDAELIEVDAQPIAARALQGGITKETLATLLTEGIATRVACPMLTTKAGAVAEVRIAEEHRFPSAYTFRVTTQTNAAGTVSLHGPVVLPEAFAVRNSGLFLRICPTLDAASERITLDAEVEWVDEPRWHDFGSPFTDVEGKTVNPVMRQPLFTSASISTSLTMDVGASQVVLVGAGGRGQILYLILTADLHPTRAQVAAAAATTPAP